MFLPASQLVTNVLLKRIEQLQGLPKAPALGLSHCLERCTQAHTSAAGLEWSSTDGHDEGQAENFQLDPSNTALSDQLAAWEAWLAAGGVVAKAQYLAAAHALVKDVLSCIIVGSEPTVSRAAVDAAWEEDAGSGSSAALPADRFKNSLAALATACSSDGAPQTAASCLASLLAQAKEEQRWQGLLEQYSSVEKQLQPPAVEAEAKEAAGGAAAEAVPLQAAAVPTESAPPAAADGDDSGDLDALLAEEDVEARDVAPTSDKAPEAAAEAAPATAAAPAVEGAEGSGAAGGAAAEAAADEDDDGLSLGLSRAASHTSIASSQASAAAATGEPGGNTPAADSSAAAAPAPRRAAPPRGLSVKSIEDPELRRALSETSSADLDELPPDDLDAVMQRQGSHAKASTRRQKAASAAAVVGVSGEGGKGHPLADLDLKAWAELKDKQQRTLPPAIPPPQRGRAPPGPAPQAPPGRNDAGKPVVDQHLKNTRGPAAAALAPPQPPGGGNPLHAAIFSGSPVRQSMERQSVDRGVVGGPGGGPGVSRHGSNGSTDSPGRNLRNLSRKLSISEPGPAGQQAEWKHLPALGQASRLHPHEGRQASYGRGAAAAGPSRGRAESAALMEDKLPALPALAGARGQPPKAMELLRRPSVAQRSDAHHADSSGGGGNGVHGHHSGPNALLPGLGKQQGSGGQGAQGARALCVQPKRSFRGDSNF